MGLRAPHSIGIHRRTSCQWYALFFNISFCFLFSLLIYIYLSTLDSEADCECGYSLNSTVFTELVESDFTLVGNITENTDWVLQEWEVSKEASKGPYGRKAQVKNVVSNPSIQHNVSAQGVNGDPAGLELFVRKPDDNQDYIGVAEADSRRTDMIYGTFRAGIKTTGVNGTCGAFFW